MELLELVEDVDTLESCEVKWMSFLNPSMNVVNTRISKKDAEDIRSMDSLGVSMEEICKKYNLTIKYLMEILRGDKWASPP